MNDRFLKDCQSWNDQKKVGFSWIVKHWVLFPSFRIITIKRMAEVAKTQLWKSWLRYRMLRMSNRYLITLPIEATVGGGILFPHGGPIVINLYAKLGEYVVIHPNVLIGGNEGQGSPKIGSRVFIGNGAKIIGDVKVGDNVFIAPGSVVVKDIPAGSVVVGNPARVISQRGEEYVSKYLH